jgi:hypothetical protein
MENMSCEGRYSGLQSHEVHLRQLCAGSVNAAATQKAPKGCISLSKQSAVNLPASFLISLTSAFSVPLCFVQSGEVKIIFHNPGFFEKPGF